MTDLDTGSKNMDSLFAILRSRHGLLSINDSGFINTEFVSDEDILFLTRLDRDTAILPYIITSLIGLAPKLELAYRDKFFNY